jgi:two-component system, OmpR family, response regulator VicR
MKKKKILIVEDDKATIRVIKLILEQDGYEFVFATNGDEAIKALDKSMDLIMLDLVLPKKDGFEILKEIRKDKKLETPVIIFSNLSRQKDMARAAELGANDYLVKSEFSASRLRQKIKKYFTKN